MRRLLYGWLYYTRKHVNGTLKLTASHNIYTDYLILDIFQEWTWTLVLNPLKNMRSKFDVNTL